MEINIRTMLEKDLPDCLAIWLAANLSAHDFIAKSYWHDHLAQVAEALPQSQVFCAFWEERLCGFAGMTNDNYLAGIFVAETMQCQSIGSKLINFLMTLPLDSMPYPKLRFGSLSKKSTRSEVLLSSWFCQKR